VACGGGAAIAVMLAARRLGATAGRVLKYAHSGEVTGDDDGVVGYLAATFDAR
jgi:AmmeMemoRadiSam system protein B